MTRNRFTTRRAFTLLEMLIVIGIIALLIGLITGVGVAVLRGREAAATKNVLVSLDRALDEYKLRVGSFPPYVVEDYEFVPGEAVELSNQEYFRQYQGKTHARRPDAAVFIRQALQVPEAAEIIRGLNERFLVLTVTDQGLSDRKKNDVTPSVVDSWSTGGWTKPWDTEDEPHLIYYVHPDNALAQALFGRCENRRPYFVSSGPDGRYGLRDGELPDAPMEEVHKSLEDNVYSYKVGEPNLTADFFNQHR